VELFLLVVLLLVVMPGLLYLVGWGVQRYTRKASSRSGHRVRLKQPRDEPDSNIPASVEA
jgi:hypothetical protein